jgi:hypothetical protein
MRGWLMTTQILSAMPRRDDGCATGIAPPLKMVELASRMLSTDVRLDFFVDWDNVAELASSGERAIATAYESNDPVLLHDVHHALYLLQSAHFAAPDDIAARAQFSPLTVALRCGMEEVMINRMLSDVDVEKASDKLGSIIREQVRQHAAGAHRLFDRLEQQASIFEIRVFFESDARLNERFFDLLAMCLVGTSGTAKTELATNLWDEAGRGNKAQGHVHLFSHALAAVDGNEPTVESLTSWEWQALAGHNLFVALCSNRKHAFRAMGLMAATELLDPPQYVKLANGCKRVGLAVPQYYSEHIEIDVVHGSGWLDNVVTPLAHTNPRAAKQILEGVALRLESCRHYYDALLQKLQS